MVTINISETLVQTDSTTVIMKTVMMMVTRVNDCIDAFFIRE